MKNTKKNSLLTWRENKMFTSLRNCCGFLIRSLRILRSYIHVYVFENVLRLCILRHSRHEAEQVDTVVHLPLLQLYKIVILAGKLVTGKAQLEFHRDYLRE